MAYIHASVQNLDRQFDMVQKQNCKTAIKGYIKKSELFS